MDDYLECKLGQLYLMKCLYDLGRLEKVWKTLGRDMAFQEDSDGEIVLDVLSVMFDSFWDDYSEECDTNIYYIRDAIIDRYFQQCQKYERKKGITPLQDPFFIQGEQFIYDTLFSLLLTHHAYDTHHQSDGSCELVYEFGTEEWFDSQALSAFAEILLYLRDRTRHIKTAIEHLESRPISVGPVRKVVA